MSTVDANRNTRSERFLSVLDDYRQVLIITHDNPDPDAIATGWGLHMLITERLDKPVRLVGGGAIVRAENRHMLELLNPPLELVGRNEVDVGRNTATVLVDCGAESSNHLLARQAVEPVAVLDHHLHNGSLLAMCYTDVRPALAASATIAASYLREQRIAPGARLATAMLYAFRTETRGHETHFTRLDRVIWSWLTRQAEPALLAEIEDAPLTRAYFSDLVLAMQNTFLYGTTALCLLPRASGPEIVGEVADLLIRCQGVKQVLCGALVADDLILSSRTEPGAGNASKLVQQALKGLGCGGGHEHRAGGKISNVGHGPKIAEQMQDELRTRWLAACGCDRQRGTRLIARREIVENL